MSARLTAYAGTQFSDFLAGRGLLLVAVTGAAAWAYLSFTELDASAFAATGGVAARDQVRRLFESLLLVVAFGGALLAARGIGHDRRRGFDRLLFARPMRPSRYYAQAFAVGGAGVVLLAGIGAEMFAVAVFPVSVGGAMAYVALSWLTIGGLAFALSAATRWYAPILASLVGGDVLLHAYVTRHAVLSDGARAGSGSVFASIAAAAQYLLPPVHVIAELRHPLARGAAVDPAMLAWPLAVGALSVAAALVVLHRRPFGS